MLQQTQVEKVIPFYERFLKKFPTVWALADAPLSDVFDSWSGLGYYSRARNLHNAAKKVIHDHAGEVPSQVEQLLKLPGIGRYTAGAVASIAYDRPAPILDGNVTRVLCRYFGIREDPRTPSIQRNLWELSAQLVPTDSPGDFNQSLMELGALICLPRSPECPICPLKSDCIAHKLKQQEQIPLRRSPTPRKKITYVCGILQKDGAFLLARRPFTGLLPGLWEFPGGERKPGESDSSGLNRILQERLGILSEPTVLLTQLKQTLSHRELEIRAFSCQWRGRLRLAWYLESRWIQKRNLKRTPMTAGMLDLAEKLVE